MMQNSNTDALSPASQQESHAAQSPRIKRTHTKSRRGCQTCKQRRVKCDEGRPACTNCERRRMQCRYATVSIPKRGNPKSKTNQEPVAGLTPQALPAPDGFEILHRDLLEHYLHHTSGTFGTLSVRSQRFWRTVVPALAYTSQAVRLGMLTMSALCLSNDIKSSDPERSRASLGAAERYGQDFVQRSSESVQSLHQREAGVHLTCSRLLTILALAWFRVDRLHRGVSLRQPEAWVWLHMLRGSALLHNRYDTNGSGIADALANELDVDASAMDTVNSYKIGPAFQVVASTRHARFEALRNAASLQRSLPGCAASTDIFFAIDCLRDITEKLCCDDVQSLIRTLLFWPASISREFVDLLETGDCLALTIYAHWLMTFALVKDAWFVEDMASAGIRDISAMLETARDRDVQLSLLHLPLRMLAETS